MKEDFFSKFKDYNKELEKILENKDFSQDTKSLLLSMFYKLEASYEDYYIVKRHCKTKQEYLENILENIKNTHSIKLVKPNDEKFEYLKENGLCDVDLIFKKINVLSNEFALLKSLVELNDFQIRLKDEYDIIKNSMSYLFNTAYDMENIEVIRDFNAWSWNALVQEIKDIKVNLIYQNLRIALNTNIFTKVEEANIDIIKYVKQNLLELYSQEIVNELFALIFKISILIYIKIDEKERTRLSEKKKKLELYWNKINDKKIYVEDISEVKKKLVNQVKKIDLMLNNKELLMQEYQRRNQESAAYNRIFNISHLVEILQMERNKLLSKIDLCNKRVDPKTYMQNRAKIQEDYNLLKDINFEGNNDIYQKIDELQIVFINNIFIEKLKRVFTKEDIIDCMYELRYYNFLPYNNEQKVKDIEHLKKEIEKAEEVLIKKMFENKIITTISTNLENDIKIIKNIFNLKIINMEQIYIQIQKHHGEYVLKIYDEKETLESEQKLTLEFNKKDRIKLNKKVKLFI